jgi:hypothetical protein
MKDIRRKGQYVRPMHDVFKYVDMKKGDKLQCWPWTGFVQPNHNKIGYPIFCWGGKRLQARRVVYALKHGLHPENVPYLKTTCGSEDCCNPDHIIERWSDDAKVEIKKAS